MDSQNPTTKYRAPFYNPNLKRDQIIPGSYIIKFRPGYSMKQHLDTVTQDLVTHVVYEMNHINSYAAKNINKTLLEAIRADPGVELVEHQYELPNFPDPEENWLTSGSD